MTEVRSPVLVETKSGPIRGQTKTTFDGLDYVSFNGIPFAKPPVGPLRFKKPEPVDIWSEPLDAFVAPPGAAAPTANNSRLDPLSNEDCLYLNICTRDVRSNPLRPVMIYIYGGGFCRGSVSDDRRGPDFLLRNDVVIVQVAYRVGALGFLSVSDPRAECPGNAGLKDQALGMRWVVDNIESFGGDPNIITLFGGSAGGMSVHMHMLSDYSKGLFHRAIMQSGSAAGFCYQRTDQQLDAALARKLGWNGEGGVNAMMTVLRSADVKDIVTNQGNIEADSNPGCYEFRFLPVVEPYDGPDCFLRASASELVQSAWGNQIPLIVGYNVNEGHMFFPLWKSSQHAQMFSGDQVFIDMIPHTIRMQLTQEEIKQRVDAMKRFYYGDEAPSFDNLHILSQVFSDAMFLEPTIVGIRDRRNQPGCAPTYLYRFSYDSMDPIFMGFKSKLGEGVRGTIHGEELFYMFHQAGEDYSTLKEDSPEMKLINDVVNIWTSFAATGNPNGTHLDGVSWDDYSVQPRDAPTRCLSLTDTLEMIDLPEEDRIAFRTTVYAR